MKQDRRIDRREFLKGATLAGAGVIAGPIICDGWFTLEGAEKKGYFESQFGISDALCERVLSKALSKGGDFADLYFEHTISNTLRLEDHKVDRAYTSVNLGVGIRTVKGDQVGYGFTQELTEKSMMAAAATAATIADSSSKQVASVFAPLKAGNYYPLTGAKSWPIKSRLTLVEDLAEKCFSRSKDIIKVNGRFGDTQKRIMVVTSDGLKAEDFQPANALSASVSAEKQGRKEQFWFARGGRKDFSYYTQGLVNEIAQKVVDGAIKLFGAVTPPAGEMPVVFAAGDPGVLLHEAIGHGFEADFNRKKISIYSEMMGQKVAREFVTIVDDGTWPGARGSINFDDEGSPSQKTVLVDKGILKSYMHDRISARHYGVAVTGNGRRESFEYYPVPRMRNTYILPGPHKRDEIIASVKKGIYIEDVSNGQVNIGQGDFAFYVSQGRLIEDGILGAPIKDVNIMGNGPKLLRDVTMVADDLELGGNGLSTCGKEGQGVPVDCGMPTVLVGSLTVGGRSGQGG
jgi:TldD protein